MSARAPIYLDNHATTAVDPRVLDAMLPFFTRDYGNAASRSHAFGWRAEAATEKARQQLAAFIGASSPSEVVWTSGATESNNLAIKGVAEIHRPAGNHIVTCASEHKAVLDPCKRLEQQGFKVTVLGVGPDGRLSLDSLLDALTLETILVSVMLANNEIGTVQPVAEIGAVCRERRILFHCDAAQGLGKIPFDVQKMNIDLASFSAHKLYGPKGIGALFVRRDKPRVRVASLIDGGGHERGMRSGTLNVPAVVGFGSAVEICSREMSEDAARTSKLRDRLLSELRKRVDGLVVNGSMEHRLPNNLNVSFERTDGEALMLSMKDVAVSSGAACTSASLEPSHVLRAIGLPSDLANGSIRFGFGRFNTEEEVDYVAGTIERNVKRLRLDLRSDPAVYNRGGLGERHGLE